MFKKNKIASSVAIGILGALGIIASAQAVHLNSDGTGQVLLFPYFNAQQGYVTNINLVNSSDDTKAVKIRFHEGKSSQDILDFNIYLSPEDVWTGSIKPATDTKGNKIGALTTGDRTCTMPSLASCDDGRCEATIPFNGHDVYQNLTAADTREGFVEVIEMGVVTDASVKAGVVHKNGKPVDCKTVTKAWDSGAFTQGVGAAAKGLAAPTGSLFGSSAILNIAEGTAFALAPVAIDDYSTQAQHYRPDDPDKFLLPSLASGNVTTSSVVVKKPTGESELVVTDWKQITDACLSDGDNLTPACGTNPYPMAHVLLAPSLMNEYFLDPTLGYDGHTDWVVSFPMKKYGINTADAQISTYFDKGLYDRNAGLANTSKAGFPTSTGTPSVYGALARHVNVLTFKSTDPSYDLSRTVLSSTAQQDLSVGPFVSGWGRLAFPAYSLASGFKSAQAYGATPDVYSADSTIYQGVPVAGAAFVEGNVSENAHARFGDAFPHKIQRNYLAQ